MSFPITHLVACGAMLTKRIESYGDPSLVEAMLVDQGILECSGAPSQAQETN